MSTAWRGVAALGLAVVLAGCAGLPGFEASSATTVTVLAAPPTEFRLEGRVSVKAGEESFSGGIAWRRDAQGEDILLNTPLGQGVAELHGDASGMTLTDAKGQSHRAADADELVRLVLGMELPLRGLAWWVTGHPRPKAPYQAESDSEGHLARLAQDDWRIEFSRYGPRGSAILPGKLVARRGEDLEVRLVVDRWELP